MLDKKFGQKLDKHFGNFWRQGRRRYASCGHAGGLSCLDCYNDGMTFLKLKVSTDGGLDFCAESLTRMVPVQGAYKEGAMNL